MGLRKRTLMMLTNLVVLLPVLGCNEDVHKTADVADVDDASDVIDATDVVDADAVPDIVEVDGMVLVPEGPFWMGCSDTASERCHLNEKPYHQVNLDAYYIDRTEVTMKAFRECVDAGGCSHHIDDETCWVLVNDGWDIEQSGVSDVFKGDNQPMVCVDWAQAKQYCEWAGKRLPTEAEWEKAARGTDGRKYPWGNQEPSCDRAVMYVNDGSECEQMITADVCSKSPAGDSPYGLCDMAGNVREFVADWYYDKYYESSPADNPKGPDTGKYRVSRGGGFDRENYVSTSGRQGAVPYEVAVFRGFRCARSAEPARGL